MLPAEINGGESLSIKTVLTADPSYGDLKNAARYPVQELKNKSKVARLPRR